MAIVTIKLKEYQKNASSTETAIIDFLLKYPEESSQLTIYSLAEKTFSSPSTIIRLCKKIGYSGYKDFLKELIYEQAIRTNYREKRSSDVTRMNKVDEIVETITQKNILSLEETSKLIDPAVVETCVKVISNSEKFAIFGIGASLIVAKDAQLKFTRVNKLAHVTEDWHTQLLLARNMNPGDVALTISYSGKTDEIVQCTEAAKENGATIITMTNTDVSPINQMADYSLYIASNEYSFRSGAMSSRISQLNIIDILYTTYINNMYDESIQLLEKTQIKKGAEND